MLRSFHKMHGLGNDFVILDGRVDPIPMDRHLAHALADRHSGIGCDQLIVLSSSDKALLAMRIFNADGSPAEACGNAARCVVALTGAKRIETASGVIEGASEGTDVQITMGEPRFGWTDIPIAYAMDAASLPMAWDELAQPMALNVGNPHLVFFVEQIDEERLAALGPTIEHDPAFPQRTNVNVARVGPDGIDLRTWERGAGLTLACGTGACATAVAAIATRRVLSPVTVRMKGGSLSIAWKPGGLVHMRGPATHVFSGEIDLDAFAQ